MPRAKTNSRSTKRQRLAANPTTSSAGVSNAERSTDSEKQFTQQFKQQLRQMDAASIHAMSMSFMSTNSELAPLVPHDDLLWSELVLNHFGAPFPPFLRFAQPQPRYRGWDWTSNTHSCQQLRDFLRSYNEREVFDNSVQIVHGDLRTYGTVFRKPIDGIMFLTNTHLTKPRNGATEAVYEPAGPRLSDYIDQLLFCNTQPVGSVVTSLGFNACVKKLIHCVGPSFSSTDCYELLETTYKNAMNAVLLEDLHCVELTSISTGNQGIPAKEAAQVGLRAIQKFLRSNDWQGTIIIVCIETDVYGAFTQAKQDILDKFNVTPLYPERTSCQPTPGTTSGNLKALKAGLGFGEPAPSSRCGPNFTKPTRTQFMFGMSESTSSSSIFGATTWDVPLKPSGTVSGNATLSPNPMKSAIAMPICKRALPARKSAALVEESKPRWFRGINGSLRPKK